MTNKKIFVLDTNVILHDSSCIYQFEENDVVIPITVLEELDGFKRGNDIINFHARHFTRELDELSTNLIFDGGVPIGNGHGRVSIRLEREFHQDLSFNFPFANPDHRILNTAYQLREDYPDNQVILVTKDVNLRMKAKSVGLPAQDYTTDHIKDVTALYRGVQLLEDAPDRLISSIYEEAEGIPVEELALEDDPLPNQYFIVRNRRKSVLATYDAFNEAIRRVDKVHAYGITPRNAEQTFAVDAMMNPDIKLVSLSGKAGTGKTLLALAAALHCKGDYQQIFMGRPIVPLSNKDTGYLPGDIESKLDPYMQPLYDNLGVIRHQFRETDKRYHRIQELLDEGKLRLAPLSYIRGRSLVKIFFIVDEAQNLTPHEVKTIITRSGENTKMIFTGDIFQIDHPYLDSHSNGLSYLIEKMQGQPLYAHINMEKGERSELAELASNLL